MTRKETWLKIYTKAITELCVEVENPVSQEHQMALAARTHRLSMHRFPKNDIVRRKWVKFVRRHRDNFTPTSTSALCSAHFEAISYSRRTDISLNHEQNNEFPTLKRLLIGASPTIDAAVQEKPNAKSIDRTRRQVSSHILN